MEGGHGVRAWGAAATPHNAIHVPASYAPYDAEARGGLLRGKGEEGAGGHVRWQCAYQARARPTYRLPCGAPQFYPYPYPYPYP